MIYLSASLALSMSAVFLANVAENNGEKAGATGGEYSLCCCLLGMTTSFYNHNQE